MESIIDNWQNDIRKRKGMLQCLQLNARTATPVQRHQKGYSHYQA